MGSKSVAPTSADAKAILEQISDRYGGICAQMMWADEEIAAARARHPEHQDLLWHSFPLLRAYDRRLEMEALYRAHCRELLRRVVAGQSTCEGTAAEVLAVMVEISLRAPLNMAGHGLYLRMWKAAGLPVEHMGDNDGHYEAIAAHEIDEAEAEARRKLAVPERVLTPDEFKRDGHHTSNGGPCKVAASTVEPEAAIHRRRSRRQPRSVGVDFVGTLF